MKSNSTSLKSRYFLFIGLVGLTIIASQFIIQTDIGQQEEDARLINIAGRQRMLSQRISKLTAYLYYERTIDELGGSYSIDTLNKLVNQWENTHEYLVQQNKKGQKSSVIDSLLNINTARLNQIATAARSIIAKTDPENMRQAIERISEVELSYLLTMESTVARYQQEAEAKLRYLKKVELVLAIIGLLILTLEFRFLIYPFVRQLRSHNKMLQQLNQQVQQERVLLRTIIDNIPVNIYVKDQHLKKILANKSEFEYLGASSEQEVIGKKDRDLYPLETALTSEEEDTQVLAGHKIMNRETHNVRNDGTHRWFMISKMPLVNADNTITGLVGISVDVTSAREAKDELAKKEKLYRLISENSQDVISLHTLDGRFEYISPSCIDLHGYTPDELIGKSGTEFMHPEDAEAILKKSDAIQKKMQLGEPLEPMQFRIASKNRGLIWVENVIKPVFTDHELTGFQSTVRDISARKLYEINLREAKEKAEEATKVKSQFLSMMSHEIRTPINGILGLTEILLEEDPREDQKEKLKLLKFSSENLLTIINHVLDFSKGEAGKIELEIIPFHLQEITEHYIKVLESKAEAKGIQLRLNIDPTLPRYVAGDPVRIGQVINNLISNAIKFTEKGAVDLSITSVAQFQHQHTIRFTVKDSGIGIPADKIDSVFDSFTQAGTETSRKYGGTGLGLTITRDLLRLMGSQITVKSEIGVGSEFSFELILPEATPAVDSVLKQEVSSHKKLTILLAEDNAVNQVVASTFLTKWGHEVIIANNGMEAVEKSQTHSIDLILMDLQMPEMDGLEAAKKIRQLPNPHFQQMPIIALTASNTTEVKDKAMSHGMNGFLSKPFRSEELWNVIQNHLSEIQTPAYSFPNIESYTDGDPVFRGELIRLFIKGLEEFKTSFLAAIETNSSSQFDEAAHKAKTTLSIINSTTLISLVAEVRSIVPLGSITSALSRKFIETIDQVMDDLRKELIV